ncbi:hypothetical protein [Chitinophaga sp. YIM B06452]|uniref:hypothetical protein n=1 Tax=Chitinophaga sp. YIM B06452 TaxID=3082158 RepID=UPI0031FE6F16
MNTPHKLDTIREDFQQLHTAYSLHRSQLLKSIEDSRTKVAQLEQQLASLEREPVAWTRQLVIPVMEAIARQLPEWLPDPLSYSFSPAEPQVGLFFYRDLSLPLPERMEASNSIYICLRPGDLEKGELLFDTSDPLADSYPDAQFIPLLTIEQAVEHLQRQIKAQG